MRIIIVLGGIGIMGMATVLFTGSVGASYTVPPALTNSTQKKPSANTVASDSNSLVLEQVAPVLSKSDSSVAPESSASPTPSSNPNTTSTPIPAVIGAVTTPSTIATPIPTTNPVRQDQPSQSSKKTIPATQVLPGKDVVKTVPTPSTTATPSIVPQPTSTPVPAPLLFRQLSNHPASLSDSDILVWNTLSAKPQAIWLGEWNQNVGDTVSQIMTDANKSISLPVFVIYNIPNRDCGNYSKGGADSGNIYTNWIAQIAAAVRGSHAFIVLEPDSLSLIDCLNSSDQQIRYGLLQTAISSLTAAGGYVYLDAGHSNWIGAQEMAHRLTSAGIAQAAGFALNVSNFRSTADEIAYGTALSQLVGNKHFVVDTSRNGASSATGDQWCNPYGAKIGTPPTLNTGNPLIDAMLWIKHPGESDGNCNGGPNAGEWWPDYAARLLS